MCGYKGSLGGVFEGRMMEAVMLEPGSDHMISLGICGRLVLID